VKVSRTFDGIDIVTSVYAEVPTRLSLFQEPLQDHVDFLFDVSNLTVTKQALNVTYDLKLQTYIVSGYRFRTSVKLSAPSVMLVMVRKSITNPYDIKNLVVTALVSPCAILVKFPVTVPHVYLERKRFSISNSYAISNKVCQQVTSSWALRIDRSFEIASVMAVRRAYSITNLYDLEKRLKMPLNCVYSVAVSMGCTGSSPFAVRLCGALSGVYGISNNVRVAVSGMASMKLEKSSQFPSKFLLRRQFPLTVPNRYVYATRASLVGKADVLSYTLIRKQMRSVYNISMIKTQGLTTIQLVKF
jgi:hypothetical protein